MKKIRIQIDKEMQEEIKKRSEQREISVSKMARELMQGGVKLESVREQRNKLKQRLETVQEKDRDDESEEKIEKLETELREVRKERDKLEGRLKAREETLEDMREFRNNAVGSFADVAGRVGGGELTEEGVVVTDGGGDEKNQKGIDGADEVSDGWWIF